MRLLPPDAQFPDQVKVHIIEEELEPITETTTMETPIAAEKKAPEPEALPPEETAAVKEKPVSPAVEEKVVEPEAPKVEEKPVAKAPAAKPEAKAEAAPAEVTAKQTIFSYTDILTILNKCNVRTGSGTTCNSICESGEKGFPTKTQNNLITRCTCC